MTSHHLIKMAAAVVFRLRALSCRYATGKGKVSGCGRLLASKSSLYRRLSSPSRPDLVTASLPPLSPAVRYLVDTNKVDPSVIAATGPNNRVLKGDVLMYLEDLKAGRIQPKIPTQVEPVRPESQPVRPATQPVSLEAKPVEPVRTVKKTAFPPPATESSYTDIPVDGMRRTIAQRLTMSKTTMPYSYASIQCNMDRLLELRRRLKAEGVVLTVNDFLVKAAALVLERLPQSNAAWVDGELQLLPSVDISVAVATESGLITPIVKNANRSSVETISSTVKELAVRARNKKLKPHEYQGGSISISNLGMYGVTEFTAIINPPQTAILAIGTLQVAPNEQGTASHYLSATLSCDTRVVDYELASRWLEEFRKTIESPTSYEML